MSGTFYCNGVYVSSLDISTSIIAPTTTLGSLLVDNGTNIDYLSSVSGFNMLTADSTTTNGIKYTTVGGGIGAPNVITSIKAGVSINNLAGGNVVFNSFAPRTGGNDTFPVGFAVKIIRSYIFPITGDTWNLIAGQSITFSYGVYNLSGTFVPFSGSPHITVNGPNTTAQIFSIDSSLLNWDLAVGDRFAIRYTSTTSTGSELGIITWIKGTF